MKEKTKILCMTDTDRGRDMEVVLPVCYFADKYLNCEIDYAFAWDVYQIKKKKPDIIILPNAVGSIFYVYCAKYAHDNGIKVFALLSEGNFWTDDSYNFWGANIYKKVFHEYFCLWSQRTYKFYIETFQNLKDRTVLTGSTEFDKYKFQGYVTKEEYLQKKNLSHYKKVIGYAGWGFAKLYNKKTIVDNRYVRPNDPNRIEWMKGFKAKVHNILKETVESNPDILFILKKHPKESRESDKSVAKNEMVDLAHYENVLYIQENEKTDNIINTCDIWLAFESTTMLQSWLIGNKPSIYLSTHQDFFRDKLYTGSHIVHSSDELNELIKEFYSTGKIEIFEKELKANRIEQIKATIGFDDGFNHLRAGYYLKKVIENLDKKNDIKCKFKFKFFVWYWSLIIGRLFFNKRIFLLLPKFKKTIWLFSNYKKKRVKEIRKLFYNDLDRFYEKNNLAERINTKEFWDEIIPKLD